MGAFPSGFRLEVHVQAVGSVMAAKDGSEIKQTASFLKDESPER